RRQLNGGGRYAQCRRTVIPTDPVRHQGTAGLPVGRLRGHVLRRLRPHLVRQPVREPVPGRDHATRVWSQLGHLDRRDKRFVGRTDITRGWHAPAPRVATFRRPRSEPTAWRYASPRSRNRPAFARFACAGAKSYSPALAAFNWADANAAAARRQAC